MDQTEPQTARSTDQTAERPDVRLAVLPEQRKTELSETGALQLTDIYGDKLQAYTCEDLAYVQVGDTEVELSQDQVAALIETLGLLPVRASVPDAVADGYGWPDLAPATILEDAEAACYGDRNTDYGHPREDFTRQAILWTGLLNHKLADGQFIDAEDIARCMVATKLARDVHSPKRDNRVDGAGYFLCLDRLETGR